MSAVEVTNKSTATIAFDLYHPLYCEVSRDCRCIARELLRPVPQPDGSTKSQYQRVVSPRAIYLAPGETIQLHPAVMRLPLVKQAEAARRIEVIPVVPAVPPAPVVVPPTTSPASPRKSSNATPKTDL